MSETAPSPRGARSERPVRAAGRGRDPRGRLVLWSVAEGGLGRRWRDATLDAVSLGLARSVLLETGPDGLPKRLEISNGLGLLTLHPEAGGVHGNLVSRLGVQPIAVDGVPDGSRFLVEASGLADAALCWSLASRIAPTERVDISSLSVALGDPGGHETLAVRVVGLAVQRVSTERWRLVAPGVEPREVRIDADGLPAAVPGERWPLEAGRGRTQVRTDGSGA